MRRVLVFGSFDGIHDGHRNFFLQARTWGEHLTVGVARDEHLRTLKQREPRFSEQTRIANVRKESVVDEVFLCDETLGTFDILTAVKPDVIVLGHDQQALAEELSHWFSLHPTDIEVVSATKYEAPSNVD